MSQSIEEKLRMAAAQGAYLQPHVILKAADTIAGQRAQIDQLLAEVVTLTAKLREPPATADRPRLSFWPFR